MADIFLSYKKEDQERVRPLVQALEAQGYSVWWDQNIEAGEEWFRRILQEVRAAKVTIGVWSRASVDADKLFRPNREGKRYVEIEHDETPPTRLIPCLLDPNCIPLTYKHVQAVDLTRWSGTADADELEPLLRRIERFFPGRPKPLSTQSLPARPMLENERASPPARSQVAPPVHEKAKKTAEAGKESHRFISIISTRSLIGVFAFLALLFGASFFFMPRSTTATQSIELTRPASNVAAWLASVPAGNSLGEGMTLTVDPITASATQVEGTLAYDGDQTARVIFGIRSKGQVAELQVTVEQAAAQSPLSRLSDNNSDPAALLHEVTAALVADTSRIPAADFGRLRYEVVDVQARPFMFFEVSTTLNPTEIEQGVAQALLLVRPTLSRFGLQEAGRPIAIEQEWNEGRNEYRFRAGLPFTGTPTGDVRGIVRVGETPVGAAIRVTYQGPEGNIPSVFEQIESLIEAHRLTVGHSYEVYLDDPAQFDGWAEREIYVLVEGDTSLLERQGARAQGGSVAGSSGP